MILNGTPSPVPSRTIPAFDRRSSGARIRKRVPPTPAFVATLARRSNARMNAGRQSGYPE